MKSLHKDLYEDAFELWHMEPIAPEAGYGPAGSLYRFDNRYGTGEYWVYFRDNLFAVNSYKMHFERPGIMRCHHAEHLSIAYYDQVESFEQTGGAPSSGSIVAYIGDEGAEYVASYQPGSHIQATSITISPDYYRDALSARFGDIPDVCHAFEIVSNRRDFPELVMLLRQIRAYRGNGISADLFYEGAVAEAIALIIARAAEIEILGSESNVAHISAEDRRVIEMLPAYIEQHLSEKLPTAALAHKSCMGLTKFKQCFHAVYGTSPGDYVAGKRIDRALDLLESTSHTVAQVGAAVGYSKPSAFNDAFRRRLGCTPNEFRHRKGKSGVRHA